MARPAMPAPTITTGFIGAGNLGDAVLATPLGTLRALARVLACRPGLVAEVEAVLGGGSAGLQAIERAVAGYLAAEQRLGRVPAGADTDALALTVAGVLHHVALTDGGDHGANPGAETRLRRAIAELIGAPAHRPVTGR
ncbi:hypothetical protein AB0M20_32315 [Actinoplanes sp. NPDC051633]|uniref:hypothetical protein n=1 Tax=Actinoplanes sp. NPDC051633 TaxID=3155670 RepID=UPI00343F0803